jgi:hypothetical protein
VNSLDYLVLDAKQAILDEQHRRFEALRREGRVTEALQQFQATMSCASDLLNESLKLLERVLENRQPIPPDPPSDAPAR